MEHITPWELCVAVVGGILALAGFINAVGSAAERIVKAWTAAKAPETSQNDRINKLEEDVREIKGKLSNDAAALEDNSKANHVTQEALLALLEHGLHGNNVEQMTKAKANLEKYLINH